MEIKVNVIIDVTDRLAGLIKAFSLKPGLPAKEPTIPIVEESGEETPDAPTVTIKKNLETIRLKVNHKKQKEGKRVEVMALMRRFKVAELSDLKEADYAAFWDELAKL